MLIGTGDIPAAAAGLDDSNDPSQEVVESKEKLNLKDFMLSKKQEEVSKGVHQYSLHPPQNWGVLQAGLQVFGHYISNN